MATKKVKKFGRGGDIVTGIGAALLGKALYDKYMSKDDSKSTQSSSNEGSGASTKKPSISEEVDKAQKGGGSKDAPVANETKEEFKARNSQLFGGNKAEKTAGGGNEGTRTPEAPPSSTRRDVNELKSNIGDQRPAQTRITTSAYNGPAVKGVDENKVDQLQRRNVGAGKKPAAKNSASKQGSVSTTGLDAGIAAGKAAADAADKRSNVMRQIRDQTYKVGTGDGQTKSTSGFGPRNTFITEESSKAANKSVGRARREQASRLFKGTEAEAKEFRERQLTPMKKGGMVKKYASGGSVKTAKPTMRSASSRADGIAIRGKTRA